MHYALYDSRKCVRSVVEPAHNRQMCGSSEANVGDGHEKMSPYPVLLNWPKNPTKHKLKPPPNRPTSPKFVANVSIFVLTLCLCGVYVAPLPSWGRFRQPERRSGVNSGWSLFVACNRRGTGGLRGTGPCCVKSKVMGVYDGDPVDPIRPSFQFCQQ